MNPRGAFPPDVGIIFPPIGPNLLSDLISKPLITDGETFVEGFGSIDVFDGNDAGEFRSPLVSAKRGRSGRFGGNFELTNSFRSKLLPSDQDAILIDLEVWKIGAMKICASEICAPKNGTPKIGTAKIGILKIDAPKIGAKKIGAMKNGAMKNGAFKIGIPKIGTPEIGTPEIGEPEIGEPEIGALKTGIPKIGEPKIGTPKIGEPNLCALKISIPEIGEPEIGEPKIGTPKIGTPEIGAKKIGEPKIGARSKRSFDRIAHGSGFAAPDDASVESILDFNHLTSPSKAMLATFSTK